MEEKKYKAWHRERKNMTKPMTLSFIAHESGLKLQSPTTEYDWLQYTGLKDRKEIEIYEGDIITFRYDKKYIVVEVKDISPYGLFLGSFGFYNTIHQRNTIEVIGNRYQNPELLK